MPAYRYFTTDLTTGVMRADTLPLHVTEFSRYLGGVGQPGTLSATFDLGALPAAKQSAYLAALEPRKTVLWAMQDNFPVWAGIIWDWPHTSAKSNQLPIEAKEIASLFDRRKVLTDQAFTTRDQFAVIQGLIGYATGKTHGAVAPLVIGTAASGVTTAWTFTADNQPAVLDCIAQFCTQQNIEYAFTPGWDTATGAIPQIQLQLGAPTLGRRAAATNLQLLYPSPAVADYAFPRIGSASVNSLTASASNTTGSAWLSGSTHGQNAADFTSGYPLLEDATTVTTSAVSSQAQIDAYADGQIPGLSGCTTIPSVTIAGGGTPTVGQITLGDEAYFAATSTLHPADPLTGAPGLQQLVRIIGWKVVPNDAGQEESTTLILGGVTT